MSASAKISATAPAPGVSPNLQKVIAGSRAPAIQGVEGMAGSAMVARRPDGLEDQEERRGDLSRHGGHGRAARDFTPFVITAAAGYLANEPLQRDAHPPLLPLDVLAGVRVYEANMQAIAGNPNKAGSILDRRY